MRVDVDGADQVAATLSAAGDQVADLDDAGRAAGRLVETDARRLAPRRSGRLVGTIRTVAGAAGAVVSAGSPAVVYAGVHEYGWPRRNIRGRHYMRDATERNRDRVLAVYVDAVDDALDEVKGV